jgi:hypothetical protein
VPAKSLLVRLGGLLLVIGSCAALLSACGSSRSGFVSDANSECAKYQQRLDAKTPPKTTRQGIDYALNYFTDLDLAVTSLREMSLPGSEAGQIRQLWLNPAQHALAGFQSNLKVIRKASLADNSATVNRQLNELRHLGSKGVDAHYLESLGVSKCLPLFGTPA